VGLLPCYIKRSTRLVAILHIAVCNRRAEMTALNVGRLACGFVPKRHAGAPRNAPIEAVNAKRATYFLATI
jgi:hypothetical protein